MVTSTHTRLIGLVILLASVLVGLLLAGPTALERVAYKQSVELGITELSPRGDTGGYAMPASGCSNIGHGIHQCPPPPPPVNGQCGPAAKNYGHSEAFPAGAVCNVGASVGASNPPNGGSDTWSCLGSNGGSTASCLATRDPAIPVVSLSASPTAIPRGQNTTLTWTVSDSSSCTASGGWSGSKLASDGTHTELITGVTANTTYTITCVGTGPDAVSSASVTILSQCTDGLDNDGDGNIDNSDAGCGDPIDDNEGDGAPDLTADTPTITTTQPFEENRVDDIGFATIVRNVGDTTSATINYTFELDLDSDDTIDATESGARGGGLTGDASFTTTPIEVFNNVRAGNHRVRVTVSTVANETETSNNTSGWTSFSVADATINLFPSIEADPTIIRADVDSDPDTTISWDTDQWPTCTLSGPDLPATAVSIDGNTIGIDGSEDVDLDFTATFTIDCDGIPGNGIDEDEVTVLVEGRVFEQ